jgi:hypothetical protein
MFVGASQDEMYAGIKAARLRGGGGEWAGEKRDAGRLQREVRKDRETGPGGKNWPNRVRIPFSYFKFFSNS